jgi:glycosyltransferase involved in cell wall biosynthesis
LKVLILANADSGLYKFRLELLQELRKLGHDVSIALPDGPYIPKMTELGCRFYETPMDRRGTNPLRELGLLLTYRRIVRETRPDAVLTYTIKPNIYGGLVCRFRKVPVIANITGLGASIENGGFLRSLTLFLYRAALKKAFRVFFQNKENMEFMERQKVVAGRKHRLIPGSGVNTDHFRYMDYPGGEKIHFLFIGRIMEEKGIEQYLDAAVAITRRHPNTVFHILGSCEEKYEHRLRLMQDTGFVHCHGFADDVREYLKFAHCTIHPSYWEGMSNVLLESAACGRPVIASDISGCREIVEDGVTGFLFERRNSAALIAAIKQFLALDRDSQTDMGLAGRLKMVREFDRKLVVAAYTDALKDIAGRGKQD